MNRNLVVGGVLFGLLLAALSVGISTFISAQDSQVARLEIQKVSDSAKKASAAGKVPSSVATADAGLAGEATSTVANVEADGGVANNLSSTGYLWSKGSFLVTDPYVGTKYMFSVDTTDGARIYKGVGLTVEDKLTVNKESLLSDVDASGKLTVKGLVTGGSFNNAGGGFVVDSKGGVQASLVKAGTGTFATGLTLTSGKFSVGTPDSGVVWDPQSKEFIVVGKVVAADYISRTGTFNLTGNVVADSFTLKSGLGSWSETGTLTTKAAVITDEYLKVGADRLLVDSSGAALKGNLGVTGDITAANVTAAGALRSNTASVTTAFSVGGDRFVIDTAAPDLAHLKGNLVVEGDVSADNFYANTNVEADNDISATGRLSAGSIRTNNGNFSVSGSSVKATGTVTVNGDIDGNFIGTIDSGVSVGSNNVTAKQNLRVGTSPSYVFTVDNSGNVAADGDLTVGGDVTVTGKVTASNIPHIHSGVAVVSGAPENVSVTGMPSSASVVLTPRFSTSNPVYVTVSAGDFDVHGDNGSYSWIATW